MSVLNIIPEPYRVQLTEGTCRGNALRQITCVVNENYSDEEYSLTVTPDGIEIVSSSPKGEYYAKTTLRQIENNVKAIVANCNEDNFIYDFLLAYGLPKATIKRQQLSAQNQSALFFSNFLATQGIAETPYILSALTPKRSA